MCVGHSSPLPFSHDLFTCYFQKLTCLNVAFLCDLAAPVYRDDEVHKYDFHTPHSDLTSFTALVMWGFNMFTCLPLVCLAPQGQGLCLACTWCSVNALELEKEGRHTFLGWVLYRDLSQLCIIYKHLC